MPTDLSKWSLHLSRRGIGEQFWIDDFMSVARGALAGGATNAEYTISTGTALNSAVTIDTFPGTGVASLVSGTFNNDFTILAWDQILTEPARAPAIEARMQMNNSTSLDCKWELALCDTTSRSTWCGAFGDPLTGAGVDTTSRTNAVAFVFDPDVNNTYCYLCAYDGQTVMWETSTLALTDISGTYVRLGIAINSSGDATFYKDGAVLATIETACQTTATLYPWSMVQTRVANGQPTVKIDYVSLLQTR